MWMEMFYSWTSGNGFAVLKRTVSVSARNRRIIYSVKHKNSYILKKPLPIRERFYAAQTAAAY
jgi:hypothetical protein